jgi:chromosome segregation ATPase
LSSEDTTKELTNGHFARIMDEFSKLRGELADVRNEFRTELTEVRKELNEVRSELRSLDDKVEARLKDTRPMWAAVEARLGEVQEGVQRIDDKLSLLNQDILDVRGDVRGHEKRISRLEQPKI